MWPHDEIAPSSSRTKQMKSTLSTSLWSEWQRRKGRVCWDGGREQKMEWHCSRCMHALAVHVAMCLTQSMLRIAKRHANALQ